MLEVRRISDRAMCMKLEIEGVLFNVISEYALQVRCNTEEKEEFWNELDEEVQKIPGAERVVIDADLNGHVGEGNTGDERVMGRYGVRERNEEEQRIVDFAKRMDMAVLNTYFKKKEEHRVSSYQSGGRRTQVDYVLCRRSQLKEVGDCKVFSGECVAKQYRMVIGKMTLTVKPKVKVKNEPKIKCWKLRGVEGEEKFRELVREKIGEDANQLPEDWVKTAELLRKTAKEVLGVTTGQRNEDKKTWWWNESVQGCVKRRGKQRRTGIDCRMKQVRSGTRKCEGQQRER